MPVVYEEMIPGRRGESRDTEAVKEVRPKSQEVIKVASGDNGSATSADLPRMPQHPPPERRRAKILLYRFPPPSAERCPWGHQLS